MNEPFGDWMSPQSIFSAQQFTTITYLPDTHENDVDLCAYAHSYRISSLFNLDDKVLGAHRALEGAIGDVCKDKWDVGLSGVSEVRGGSARGPCLAFNLN